MNSECQYPSFNISVVCFSDGTVFDRVIVRGNEVIVIGHLPGAHVTIVKANNEGVISSQKSIPAAWINKETR